MDTLLVLDLVRLAQLRAFDIALIIAGDRDLAKALRVVVDDHARRVILFSVEGSSPAKELVHAADDHGVIRDGHLRMLVGQSVKRGPERRPAAPRTSPGYPPTAGRCRAAPSPGRPRPGAPTTIRESASTR